MARLLLILLVLLPAARVSAGVVTVDENFSSRLVGLDLEVLKDPQGEWERDEVETMNFQPNPWQVPAIGYSHATHWYRFDVRNTTPETRTTYLELAIAWIDHFIIYYQDQGHWVQRKAGVAYPLSQRTANNNLPTHRLDLPPNSQMTIYIRVWSSDTLIFPIYLRSEAHFESYVRHKDQLYGLFAGIMGVAAFYGFIFFVYTWNRAYLYYLLNTLSWFLMFAVWDGYGRELIFGDNYWWNKHANVFAMCSSLFWGALFTLKILEIPSYSKVMTRIMYSWMILQSIMAALAFVLPYAVMMQASASIALCFPTLLLACGITAVRNKFAMGKYYILSWTAPIIGVIFFNGMVVGLIPGSPLHMYALHVGILGQSMFLSFALSHHMQEATQNASILKVSVEAAGVAHSALMKSDLSPQHFELCYRYQPCEESGGDLFSCLQDPRGSFSYMMVADVSGHGIAAAIISSAFTGAFNSAIKGMQSLDLCLEDSCKKILNDINLVMCDYFARSNHFASAVLVGVDLRNGDAVYINAGHRNIFLKQGNRVSAFLRGGALIGFQPNSHFTPVPLCLQPDDMIVLFTDGLVENEVGRSEKARLDLIAKSLRESSNPQEIVDRIWQPIGILQRGGRQHFDDDMTLLVIKLTALMLTNERRSL